MRSTPSITVILAASLWLAVAASSICVGAAAPQSDSELRRMNERLEQRVRQLEAELAAALTRLKELEKELAAQKSTNPVPGQPPSMPDGSVDPSAPSAPTDPNAPAPPTASAPASPYDNSATILDAVLARFQADFAGKPSPRPGDNDERLNRLWTTEIERWANMINRELRRPVIWNVGILSAHSQGRSWRLEVICADPTTGADVGRPFTIQLQQPQSASLELSQRLGTANGDFTLRAVYIPQIAINPMRYEIGPFDQPPFIGTYLEYGFRMTVTSLTAVERRGTRRAQPTDTTPAPGGSPPGAPSAPSAPPSGGPSAPVAPPTTPAETPAPSR